MSNTKRIPIRCWNCKLTYTLLKEFDGSPILNVACPYCNKLGEVRLGPYDSPVKIIIAGEEVTPFTMQTLTLPDVLPSYEPAPDEEE